MVSTGPIRGDFPSLKLGRMVRYNSTIERDLLYFLEYWRTVTWYQEQPRTIEWQMPDGQIHRYIPDYEIHESAIKIIAECKPEDKLLSKHAKQQCHIGRAWADENDFRFVTYTDTTLRAGYQLDNLKLFWRYARLRHAPTRGQLIFAALHSAGGTTLVADLCQQLGRPAHEVVPVVCHLLFHQRLQMNLDVPFSMITVLWVVQE